MIFFVLSFVSCLFPRTLIVLNTTLPEARARAAGGTESSNPSASSESADGESTLLDVKDVCDF